MKKLLSATLAAALCLSASSAVFAADTQINESTADPKNANTTITASKPATYTVVIPESATAEYDVEDNTIGDIVYASGNLEPNAKVTVELTGASDFTNDKDSNSKIPYSIESNGTVFTAADFPENTADGTKVPLSVKITKSDWAEAKAGQYTATLTFTVTYTA